MATSPIEEIASLASNHFSSKPLTGEFEIQLEEYFRWTQQDLLSGHQMQVV